MPYSDLHLLCNELQIVLGALELGDKDLGRDAVKRMRLIIIRIAEVLPKTKEDIDRLNQLKRLKT